MLYSVHNHVKGDYLMGIEENKNEKSSVSPTLYGSAAFEAQRKKEEEHRRSFIESSNGISWGLLWLFAFVAGALLCEGVFRGGSGFGMAIACAAFLVCTLVFAQIKYKKFNRSAIFPAAALVLLEIFFCINASSYGRGWLVLAAIILSMMTASSLSGCSQNSQLEPAGFFDALNACVAAPFSNLGNTVAAIKEKPKQEKKNLLSGNAGKIAIGVLIALPVAVVLLAAFSCADNAFGTVIGDFLDKLSKSFDEDILDELGGIIWDIVFGAFATLYFVPLALSLRHGKQRETSKKEQKFFLDGVICATVCFIAAAVYIFFIAFQFKYFFSVSLKYFFSPSYDVDIKLPGDVTWAEYARSGFFELSAIIGVTFAVIALLIALCRRGEDGKLPSALKIALTIISACDIVLVLSSALRMRLYTIWCGLTGLRIAVLTIVCCFALCLVAAIIKLWYEKLKLMRFITAVALIGVCVFSGMNVDKVCAEYNVNRHITEGTSIDMKYLGSLSCAAAPAVERLMEESEDPVIRAAARGILAKYKYYGDKPDFVRPLDERRWGKHNLDSLRALEICNSHALLRSNIDDYYHYAKYQQMMWDHLLWEDEYMSYEEWLDDYEDYYTYSSDGLFGDGY